MTTLMLPTGTTVELPDGVDPEPILASIRTAIDTEIGKQVRITELATPAPPVVDDADNPDFGGSREPVRFRLRGQQYELRPTLSGAQLAKLASLPEQLPQGTPTAEDIPALIGLVAGAIRTIAGGAVGVELHDRLLDEDEGFDFTTEVMPLLQYLMRKYTKRPLGGSWVPSTGSAAAPTATPAESASSTDGA